MTTTTKISKSLSYWLRHAPEAAGLPLDANGWAPVDAVLEALARQQLPHAPETLRAVVAGSDKHRFELAEDGRMIRARQGHSVNVDAEWPEAVPPVYLYHGTVEPVLEAILAEGLKPMARHHVHLSPNIETATQVGSRRGKPVVLRVAAGRMAAGGQVFYLSSNNVWLTAHVPPAFLERV